MSLIVCMLCIVSYAHGQNNKLIKNHEWATLHIHNYNVNVLDRQVVAIKNTTYDVTWSRAFY